MVKSKKRYNTKKYNIKKKFLTKKNLRGGGDNAPELPEADYDDDYDISGIPKPPPEDYCKKVLFSNEAPTLDVETKILEKNKYIKDSIRFFENEIEDNCYGKGGTYEGNIEDLEKKQKVRYLLQVYQFLKNKYKTKQTDFFSEKDLDQKVCAYLPETGISVKMRYQPKPGEKEKYKFFVPRLHGIYENTCRIKKLPSNIYLCFLTKFNNSGLKIKNDNDIFKFFRNINKNTFNSISENLSLYGLSYSLKTNKDKNYVYSECFRSASWYYPLQYYLDLSLSFDELKNINFYYEIFNRNLESIGIRKHIINKNIFLSDFVNNICSQNPYDINVIFIQACRVVEVENSIKHINLYMAYEYLMRNINRQIQENKNGLPPKIQERHLTPYCANVSILKEYVMYKYQNTILDNVNSFNYDLNYHIETEILKEISDYYRSNTELHQIHIDYISSLSPNKIIKFLHKHPGDDVIPRTLHTSIFEKTSYFIRNLSYKKTAFINYNEEIIQTLIYKLQIINKLILPEADTSIFRYLKNPHIQLKLSMLSTNFVIKNELIVSDLKITIDENPFSQEIEYINLKNVEIIGGQTINFKNLEKIKSIDIEGSARVVSVSSLLNQCINLRKLRLVDKGVLIQKPENLILSNLINLSHLELINVKVGGGFFVNKGIMSNLKTIILENTNYSIISVDNMKLDYFHCINNRNIRKIDFTNCSIHELKIHELKIHSNFQPDIILNSTNLIVNNLIFRGNILTINKSIFVNNYLDLNAININVPEKIIVKDLKKLILHNIQHNLEFIKHSVIDGFMFEYLKYLEIRNCPLISNIGTYFSAFCGNLKVKCDIDLPVYKDLLKLSKQRNIEFI